MAAKAPKQIGAWNNANPEAATAADSAAKTVAAIRVRPAPRADGKIKCVNAGCNALYTAEENGDTACAFHEGTPVFHDRAKVREEALA